MKRPLLGQWGNGLEDVTKRRSVHLTFGSLHGRAEAALEIANIANLDVDFGETLHPQEIPLILGVRNAAHPSLLNRGVSG